MQSATETTRLQRIGTYDTTLHPKLHTCIDFSLLGGYCDRVGSTNTEGGDLVPEEYRPKLRRRREPVDVRCFACSKPLTA